MDRIGFFSRHLLTLAILAASLATIVPLNATELVRFESAAFTVEPSSLRVRQALNEGVILVPKVEPGVPLEGHLTLPEGQGPFSAVVLLHGCAGVSNWNVVWSERLVAWGYAVLDVDSFKPRGLSYICDGRGHTSASSWNRALDAFGAKRHLAMYPSIDAERVAVMGMSHGGAATLYAIERAISDGAGSEPFSAAISFYPLCKELKQVVTPTLIMIGEADQWTPSEWCIRYVENLPEPNEVTLRVFPDAHHIFDIEGMDGEAHGLAYQYHSEAASEAETLAREFLTEHLD